MPKDFMPDVEPDKRLQLLIDNCDAQEETNYYRDLTPEELDVKREQLTENLVKMSEFDEVLETAKTIHKAETKPLKDENKILLTEVRTRKASIKGKLFHIADHANKVMETFDENGEFIQSRRLRPDERQGRLFVAGDKKTANGE